MKRLSLIAIISIFLSIVSVSEANAETITFPCGEGATYSVVIPSGVAKDGSKCSGSLVIDSLVKIIGKDAFSFSKIKTVKIPDSVISIEAGGLAYLNLESIDLGNSIESIGFEALRGTRVSSIKLPNSLKTIGDSALADTSFAEIIIPNSVTSIERLAFAREDSRVPLKTVVIPDSVKSLGFGAFISSGITKVEIGRGLKEISARAFERNKIAEVTIPSNIATIGAFAFRENPLQQVNFGNSVEVIDSEAFAYTQLKILNLPKSLSGIGTKAFANIPTLKEIDFPDNLIPMFTANNAPTVGDIFEGSYGISRVLYCGKATGFYVPPTCEGSRKVAFDSASASATKVSDDEEANREKAKLEFEAEQQASIQQAIQLASVSAKPISIKIVGENPRCPNGFIQTLPARESNTAYGKVILCESIVKSPEERAAAVDKAAADKAAADKAAADKAAHDKSSAERQKIANDFQEKYMQLIKIAAEFNALLDSNQANYIGHQKYFDLHKDQYNSLKRAVDFPGMTRTGGPNQSDLDSLSKLLLGNGDDIGLVAMWNLVKQGVMSFDNSIKLAKETSSHTLVCVKGKITKIIVMRYPKCPVGYKVKK